MNLKTRGISAGVVAGVALLVTGVAIARSQGDGPSPTAFFDAVAKHLGISSEELEEATKAAALDQVDAALADGRITEEQAERLKERIESGEFVPLFGVPFFGPGFGPADRHGHFHLHAPGDQLTAAADYLGLTVDELRDELLSGRSLADVARAEEKSVDGLKEAMLAALRKQLDEAVADGDLTGAQAEDIRARVEEHIDDVINGSVERWHGRFFFRGGPGADAPAPPFSGIGV